jgi:hypothetical protein
MSISLKYNAIALYFFKIYDPPVPWDSLPQERGSTCLKNSTTT